MYDLIRRYSLLVVVALSGCSGGGSEEVTSAVTLESAEGFSLDTSYYFPPPFFFGSFYQEIRIDQNGDVFEFHHFYTGPSKGYVSSDHSLLEEGEPFAILTDEGWEPRGPHVGETFTLTANNRLIDRLYTSERLLTVLGQSDLSGKSLDDVIGGTFTGTEGKLFSEGAVQYEVVEVREERWILNNENCGVSCGWPQSIGEGTINDWVEQHLQDNESIFWGGLVIYLKDDGALEIWRDGELQSGRGEWEVLSHRGEEVLEITVPNEVKHDIGVVVEANPIVANIDGLLYSGNKYVATSSIPEQFWTKIDYLNNIAIEDIKAAYIAGQQRPSRKTPRAFPF